MSSVSSFSYAAPSALTSSQRHPAPPPYAEHAYCYGGGSASPTDASAAGQRPSGSAPRPAAAPTSRLRHRRHDPYTVASAESWTAPTPTPTTMPFDLWGDGRLLSGYTAMPFVTTAAPAVPSSSSSRRVRQNNPYVLQPSVGWCTPEAVIPPRLPTPFTNVATTGGPLPAASTSGVGASTSTTPALPPPSPSMAHLFANQASGTNTTSTVLADGGDMAGTAAKPGARTAVPLPRSACRAQLVSLGASVATADDTHDAHDTADGAGGPASAPPLPAWNKNWRRRLSMRLSRLVAQGVVPPGTTLATRLGQQVMGLTREPLDPAVAAAAEAILLPGANGCDAAAPARDVARRFHHHHGERPRGGGGGGGGGSRGGAIIDPPSHHDDHNRWNDLGEDDDGAGALLMPSAGDSPVDGDVATHQGASGRGSPASWAMSLSAGGGGGGRGSPSVASRSLSPVAADLLERTWADVLGDCPRTRHAVQASSATLPPSPAASAAPRHSDSHVDAADVLGLPPVPNRARHDFVPPLQGFFDRCVPHDVSPMPGVLGRFETRVLKPHLRVGGICGEVEPVAIARAVEALCGVRVAAISTFRAIHGLAVVRLRDPAREAAVVQRALHQTAWMSQRAIYWVRRPEAEGAGAASAESCAAADSRRQRLESFAHSMMPGSRLPRRLMTCEEWTDERPSE